MASLKEENESEASNILFSDIMILVLKHRAETAERQFCCAPRSCSRLFERHRDMRFIPNHLSVVFQDYQLQ